MLYRIPVFTMGWNDTPVDFGMMTAAELRNDGLSKYFISLLQ